ncbi:MAG: hypothetical protein A2X79_07500 [Desulfuromonadaceae bacterium GWB2_53_15]|nr:MAG: hypothetical protein A2X79_07500 [Desulfuromonadaceae bacterium GWB2_53_15]
MPLSERYHKIWTVCRMLVEKFLADRCLMYASALAFSSMLSIVPFLAILFAILTALNMHNVLAPMILSNVAAGSHEVVNRILHYISNTHVGSLGAVGLVTLLLSVMATLDNVEDAFNQIWGLKRGKKVHHKLRDYLVVIFSIPILVTLTVTITTSLQHQGVVQWFFHLPGFGHLLLILFRFVPYLSIWIALVCLYLLMPNTRVRVGSALAGGLVAGTIWQLAQWGYIHFQIGVSRYNAIYGTMALLPVFMVWILTSWVLVLAGMELVWFLQCGTVPPAQPQTRNKEGGPE